MADFDRDTWAESYYQDVYNSPKKLGVETVGDLSLSDEAYQFDILLVSRDPRTGKFYVNQDSGCSCPSPFESYTTRASLGEPLNAHAAVAEVRSVATRYQDSSWTYSDYKPDASDLISKIMSY